MTDIIDIIDRFWSISDNKAISIDIIVAVLTVMAFWGFKPIRHPRYRLRITFVIVLVLSVFNSYYLGWIVFNRKHVFYCGMLCMLIIIVVLSTYKPTLSYLFLKRLKRLVDGGYTDKAKRYFCFLRFITFSTASRLYYKELLATNYANMHEFVMSYNTLYQIKTKRLFKKEIDLIETHMAYYLIQLGDVNNAKKHIQNVENNNPLLILILAMINDVSGQSPDEILPIIQQAIEMICSDTDPFIQSQVYLTYAHCREKQNNYEDSFFYALKALDHAKRSRNKELILNTYEQLIILLCGNNTNDPRIGVYYEEYKQQLPNTPKAFIRSYNFAIKYYRMRGLNESVLMVITNGYTYAIERLHGSERYHWEVSNLEVAFESGIRIDNIMSDVERDFMYYFSIPMPNRHSLISTLYRVLDQYYATVKKEHQIERYRLILNACEEYLAQKASLDLDEYYQTLDIHQVYQRCHVLHLMVSISSTKEWYSAVCKKRFDKAFGNAHQYDGKSIDTETEHTKRIERLRQIANIASTSGLKPHYLDALIDVVEECYSVYWVSQNKQYDLNIIDRVYMEEYIDKALSVMLENVTGRFQAQLLKITAQLCVLGRFNEAKDIYRHFDRQSLVHFNRRVNNYYLFVEDVFNKDRGTILNWVN